MRHRLLAPLALGLALSLTACARDYIPNTDVPASEENRKIINFCERYRKAVEKKNIAELVRMASPRYYEDGGNVDAADDLDYAGLQEYLANQFLEANSIRYEIKYRRILHPEEKVIFVDYTFSASYRIPNERGEEEWHRKVDDNRLELEVLDNGEMRILAGM